MSFKFRLVHWNRQKIIYDGIIFGLIFLYLSVFIVGNLFVIPEITRETLIIRAFGTLSLILLHIVLSIGPLTRLNPIFLPLLYNRRHLGVTTFFIASVHGIFSIIQFHSSGNVNPLLSIFISNTRYESFTSFPFQTLGFVALIILFIMAFTSHDFWLEKLGTRFWKTLHMLVYLAYFLIIIHVQIGVMQFETSTLFSFLIGIGMVWIITIHLIAGRKEFKFDNTKSNLNHDGFVPVCHVDEIKNNRAKVVSLSKNRVAIFKYGNKISAISNICKHQNGPLGEGRIIDGCITCPWHGYQYLPNNGTSPPPFTEKVATYSVMIKDNKIWVNPAANAEGEHVEPALINQKL